MEGKRTIPEDMVWQELGGQTVVVDPGRRVTWVLNSTATRIWREIRSGASVEAVARAISSALGLDAGLVFEEVASFCRELGRRGLLSDTSCLASAAPSWSARAGILWPVPQILQQARSPKPRRPSPEGTSGPW